MRKEGREVGVGRVERGGRGSVRIDRRGGEVERGGRGSGKVGRGRRR